MTFIKYHNPGDRLSISANEWNEIARAVNELKGTSNARSSSPLLARIWIGDIYGSQKTEVEPGDILIYMTYCTHISTNNNSSIGYVTFPVKFGAEHSVLPLRYNPVYVKALKGGKKGDIIPVVATGCVEARFNDSLDQLTSVDDTESANLKDQLECLQIFAEVDRQGQLYIVTYPTEIQVIYVNRNTHRGLVLLNCGARPTGQFDTFLDYDDAKWTLYCWNSSPKYGLNAYKAAGYIVGGGINNVISSLVQPLTAGQEYTVRYHTTWSRPDDEHPGAYTKQELEIVTDAIRRSVYTKGESITTIATVFIRLGTYPLIERQRPLGPILVPDITY